MFIFDLLGPLFFLLHAKVNDNLKLSLWDKITFSSGEVMDDKPVGYTFGRPSKYKPEYIQQLIDFANRDYTREETREVLGKDGVTLLSETTGNWLPTLERFSREIGVDPDTILAWSKKHPDFHGAIKHLKAVQKDMLTNNGLQANYNPTMSIFLLKCNHGLRETDKAEDGGVNIYLDGKKKDVESE